VVYDALCKPTAQKMAQEKPGQTLQPAALVHEPYLRLVDTEKARRSESRGHFFAAVAEAMSRILVQVARVGVVERKGAKSMVRGSVLSHRRAATFTASELFSRAKYS
jgi:hypothetical protein